MKKILISKTQMKKYFFIKFFLYIKMATKCCQKQKDRAKKVPRKILKSYLRRRKKALVLSKPYAEST